MKDTTRIRIRRDMLALLREKGPQAAGHLGIILRTSDETARAVRNELAGQGLVRTWTGTAPPESRYRGPARMWVAVATPEQEPEREIRWTPADLDRCEHGRHSIDHCLNCPGGQSHGNLFLFSDRSHFLRCGRGTQEDVRMRIGTTVHGQPIVVQPVCPPREQR